MVLLRDLPVDTVVHYAAEIVPRGAGGASHGR
jgi:hypothetical protein